MQHVINNFQSEGKLLHEEQAFRSDQWLLVADRRVEVSGRDDGLIPDKSAKCQHGVEDLLASGNNVFGWKQESVATTVSQFNLIRVLGM